MTARLAGSIGVIGLMLAGCSAAAAGPQTAPSASPGGHLYHLDPSPTTIAYGYYDAAAKPVLRIKSGDRVQIGTLITSTPTRLARAGVPDSEIQPSLKDIVAKVTDKGPGGHILTGPIYVEGWRRARRPGARRSRYHRARNLPHRHLPVHRPEGSALRMAAC